MNQQPRAEGFASSASATTGFVGGILMVCIMLLMVADIYKPLFRRSGEVLSVLLIVGAILVLLGWYNVIQ
jgi:hypothetical protein